MGCDMTRRSCCGYELGSGWGGGYGGKVESKVVKLLVAGFLMLMLMCHKNFDPKSKYPFLPLVSIWRHFTRVIQHSTTLYFRLMR